MADSETYLDLITPYHRGRPKFTAMVRGVVEPPVAQQNLLTHLPLDFDLDLAIGAQLDVVGEWVGRTRFIQTPITGAWFSFDDPLRGFEQGVWFQPFDTTNGITRLDDETYRTLLRAKIAANNWDGTLPAAKAALEIVFPEGETKLIITDNQDMTITFGVSGVIPSVLFIALLSDGYLPLKPEGVRADYLITTVSAPPTNWLLEGGFWSDDGLWQDERDWSDFGLTQAGQLFGFDVQNEYISGFDTGAWGAPPSYFTA